jgi:hypothetical protein
MHHLMRTLAISGAVASSMLLSVSPSFARPPTPPTVNWQEVGQTDANWECTGVANHPAAPGVRFRGCTVVNSSNQAQAVLVLVNNSSSPIQINGGANTRIMGSRDSWHSYIDVRCASSPLHSGFQRGCFSRTKDIKSFPLTVHILLTINGESASLDFSRSAA